MHQQFLLFSSSRMTCSVSWVHWSWLQPRSSERWSTVVNAPNSKHAYCTKPTIQSYLTLLAIILNMLPYQKQTTTIPADLLVRMQTMIWQPMQQDVEGHHPPALFVEDIFWFDKFRHRFVQHAMLTLDFWKILNPILSLHHLAPRVSNQISTPVQTIKKKLMRYLEVSLKILGKGDGLRSLGRLGSNGSSWSPIFFGRSII